MPSSDTSTTDGVAGALAPTSAAAMPPAIVRPPSDVAERRALVDRATPRSGP